MDGEGGSGKSPRSLWGYHDRLKTLTINKSKTFKSLKIMSNQAIKPALPACLVVETLAKWIDKDQHKFKLRLTNTETKQSMDFDYSGGSMAFLPEKRKLPTANIRMFNETLERVRSVLLKKARRVMDDMPEKDAMKWANDNAFVDPCGVIHSLLFDSQAGQETFSNFCSNCGYEEDSRKALATWEKCVAISSDFNRVCRGMVPELETLLADY